METSSGPQKKGRENTKEINVPMGASVYALLIYQ